MKMRTLAFLWLAGSLTLTWAQNFGIGTTTPTERLDVEGGRLRVRAYSGTGTRLATVDPTGVFGTVAGNAPGEVLQWNGTAWVPATLSLSGDDWGTQTALTSGPITGTGITGSPITFAPGTTAGQVWQWNGTAWTLATLSQTAATQAPITGDGTAGNPIRLQNGTAPGQILIWTGTAWTPAPNPICPTPTQNRFLRFTSTSPLQTCNATLAENNAGNIWNADGAGAPLFGGDKFAIIGTGARPWAINGYTNTGNAAGVYGENLAGGTGVVGAGGGTPTAFFLGPLAGGSGGAFTGGTTGIFSVATTNNDGSQAGLFQLGTAPGAQQWAVGANVGGLLEKIVGPGNASTLASSPGGFRDKIMFCPEAPEILFMDFGTGQLQNGRAYIELDPIFANNIVVDERHPLRVYIQLEDDCEGVYVTNKSIRGFEVRELRGGRSNARFSWQVVANRRDEVDPTSGQVLSRHEGVRFPPAPKPLELKEVSKQHAKKLQSE